MIIPAKVAYPPRASTFKPYVLARIEENIKSFLLAKSFDSSKGCRLFV
jgi:hypothetical protein